MKMALTINQQQFVNQKDSNVLVSASAGCGKTTTMIEKLIELILKEKVDVSQLLVVTFTNAAGNEMRQKLYKRLYRTILEEQLEEDEKTRLMQQLENVYQADIGTLHAICKKLIEKYFYVIDLDPQFVILEDNECSYLLTSAIEEVIKEYIQEKDDAFRNLFEYFNKKRKNTHLIQVLMQLYHYLTSKTDKELWKKQMEYSATIKTIGQHPVIEYLYTYFYHVFSAIQKEVHQLLADSKVLGLDTYSESLQLSNHYLKEILSTKDLFAMDQAINRVDLKDLRIRTTKKVDPECVDFVEEYKTLIGETTRPSWDSVRGVILYYQKYVQLEEGTLNVMSILSRMHLVQDVVEKLFEAENRVAKKYAELKAKRNGLDFNDLEHLTLQILQNEEARKEIAHHYQAVFVDEYQDINEIQESIISQLAALSRLYMIGDVKQSIYGFRNCTPDIFLEKSRRFALDGIENILIGLNDNFRSHGNILAFVNDVCDYLMTPTTIGIDYRQDSRLCPGMVSQTEANGGDVLIRLIEKEDLDKELQIQLQAEEVLSMIVKHIGQAYTPIGSSEVKYFDYKDFAVLTRNKGELVERMYDLLTQNGIPVATSFNSNLFKTEEIMLMIAILEVLNNAKNELAYVTVLLSPIGQLTEQDLVNIKQKDKSIMESLLLCAQDNHVAKCMDAFVQKYREYLVHHTVVETLETILNQYDLIHYFGTLPDGLSRVNHIKVFLTLIGNDSINYNLSKTIEYIKVLQEKENFEISVASSDNSVQMMTMHKSKGLEYPFVIIAGLGNNFNEELVRQELVLSNRFGVGMRYRDVEKRVEKSNLLRSACILDKMTEERKEEIRLLYVALTRAKNKLALVGCAKQKVLTKSPLQCKSHMEMILSSMPSALQDNIWQQQELISQFGASKIAVKVVDGVADVPIVTAQKPILTKQDDVLVEKLHQLCEKSQTYIVQEPIALKNTVSQILMEDSMNYTNTIESPHEFYLAEASSVSLASKIGTAYHKVVELMDFRFEQNAQQVLNRLIANKQIDPDVVPYIQCDKIDRAIVTISQWVGKNSVVLKEAQFMYKDKHKNLVKGSQIDQPILIQGMVDCLIINGKTGYLIDYKTNKNCSIVALKEKYQKQLELYSLAVKEAYHLDEIKSFIYAFDHEKLIEM